MAVMMWITPGAVVSLASLTCAPAPALRDGRVSCQGITRRGWTPLGSGRTVRQGHPLSESKAEGYLMAPAYHYQIRVAGTLPPEVLLDFAHLRASAGPAGTMIHGALPDQAVLCGLLTRLETSGAR